MERAAFHNPAELLDRCFAILRKSFWQQIGMFICFNMIMTGALFLFLIFGGMGFAISIASSSYAQENIDLSQNIRWIVLLAVALVYIVTLVGNMALSAANIISWQVFSEKKVDFGDAMKRAFTAAGRLASVAAAQLIVIAAVCLIAFAALYYAIPSVFSGSGWVADVGRWYMTMNPREMPPVGNFFALLAIILGIGLLFAVVLNYFTLSVPAALFDRRHFFGAFKKSFLLLKGDFWRTLGIRAVFFGVIYIVEYSIVGLITIAFSVMSALAVGGYGDYAGWMSLSIVLLYGASMVAGAIVAPLQNIFTAVIFFNQKIKKEGLDIGMALEKLERDNVF